MNAGASPGPSTGVTFWSLVEARAATSPDALLAVDESGRTTHVRGVPRRGREGRRRARRPRRGRRRRGCRGSSPPGSRRSCSSARCAGSVRCRTRCSRSTGSASSGSSWARSVPSCWSSRASGAGSTIAGRADSVVDELHDRGRARLPGADVRPHAARRRPGRRCPRRRPTPVRCAGCSTRRARRPTRRVRCTPTRRSSPDARAVADRYEIGESDRYPMVFPFTHIGGVGMLVVQLLTGLRRRSRSSSTTPSCRRRSSGEHDVTIPAGGTPLALLYLQYQRAASGTARVPRRPCRHDRRRAQAAGPARRAADEIGGVGAVSVYGLTEAPFLVVGSVRDPAAKLATTEGRAVPGVELRVVAEDGRVCGPDEVGEIRARGVGRLLRVPEPRPRRRRVRRRRLLPHRRPRPDRRRRLRDRLGPAEGRHHPQGREHLGQGGRGRPVHAPRRRRGRGRRPRGPACWASAAARSCSPSTATTRRRSTQLTAWCDAAGLATPEVAGATRDRHRLPAQRERQGAQVPAPRPPLARRTTA